MKQQWFFVAAALVVFAAGCNTLAKQPEIKAALIAPEALGPGESAIITLEVVDKHAVIDRIVGVVKEDPRISFRLQDDGAAPDKKAADGVWTLQVDVPFQAPPGEFVLEFTAYRSDGIAVPVRDAAGEVTTLQASVPVVIRYAQQ